MEISENTIETLFVRAEEYGKTNIDLLKLKSTKATANSVSEVLYRVFLLIVISFLLITLSIAAALFIGELLGENYYGFLVVSAFYTVVLILVFSMKKSIRKFLKNKTVSSLLN